MPKHVDKKAKLERILLIFSITALLCGCYTAIPEEKPEIPRPLILCEPPVRKNHKFEKLIPSDILDPEYVLYKPTIYNDEIDEYIRIACRRFPNVSQFLVHSIIWHESRYQVDAKNGSCVGLMQMSTIWHTKRAQALGFDGDLYNPYTNIFTGVDYLNDLIESYGDLSLVLMIYNGQANATERYKSGDISWYARSVMEMANELEVKYYAEKEVGGGSD